MNNWSRLADVRFRHVGDETVVLRQRAAEVLVINEVGGRILELVDGRSVADIVDQLLREFTIERGMLERDVAEFLGELERKGIVARSG